MAPVGPGKPGSAPAEQGNPLFPWGRGAGMEINRPGEQGQGGGFPLKSPWEGETFL